MTSEQALELVDRLTKIAVMTVELNGLRDDDWSRADDLKNWIDTERMAAADLLWLPQEALDTDDLIAAEIEKAIVGPRPGTEPQTLAQKVFQAEVVAAAREAAEHAEEDIRRRVEQAIAETQATVDKALREDELGKLQAGAPSPMDGKS